MPRAILPLAAMEKLLKKADKTKRIADNAKIILSEELEKIGLQIGIKAGRFADHAKRKTIKKEDIREAIR